MKQFCPQRLVLIRHGQSTLNAARAFSPVFFETDADRKAFESVPDHEVPLTEKGIQEARALGQGLRARNFDFDVACDSGYKRTVQTLDYVLEAYSPGAREAIEREHNMLIREREGGYTYCMTGSESETCFPWLDRYWKSYAPIFSKPVGGESIAEVVERVTLFLLWNADRWQGKRVLISSHGRTITAFRYILEGWSFERLVDFLERRSEAVTGERTPRNCSMTSYTWSTAQQRLALDEYNTCFNQARTVELKV